MKNRCLAALTGALLFSQSVTAQLIQPGETFIFDFSDLAYLDDAPGELGSMSLSLSIGQQYSYSFQLIDGVLTGTTTAVPTGPLNISLFEHQDSPTPFFTETEIDITGSAGRIYLFPDFNAINYGPGYPELVNWSDREGRIEIGSSAYPIDITSISISVLAGGVHYAQSYNLTAVPLPASAWLLGSGLLALCGMRRVR